MCRSLKDCFTKSVAQCVSSPRVFLRCSNNSDFSIVPFASVSYMVKQTAGQRGGNKKKRGGVEKERTKSELSV